VLVLGGGLAGISAALELQRLGRRVLVVERSSQLGGKAGSTHTAIGSFPTGPTSFNGSYPVFWRLLDLLGLREEATRLRPASSARYIVRDGRLNGLRPHPLSVLGTGALSLGDKWALAKEFLSPSPARIDVGDESLESLLVRRFGQKTVESDGRDDGAGLRLPGPPDELLVEGEQRLGFTSKREVEGVFEFEASVPEPQQFGHRAGFSDEKAG